jgi:hypothetical protein
MLSAENSVAPMLRHAPGKINGKSAKSRRAAGRAGSLIVRANR